jgi:hypothetical protein
MPLFWIPLPGLKTTAVIIPSEIAGFYEEINIIGTAEKPMYKAIT